MQDPVAKRNLEELYSKLFEVKFDLSGTDYEAIENIGSGAYGVVCSATNKRRPGERVAIKKIPDIFSETTIAIAMRTYREIRILKHFRHDNIISIREILRPHEAEMATFTDVYIVLDLMESDLHRIIYSRQELTDEHVRYFLYQILRGLKYIHSANVVHRDLKPSNLLINENCELKIGDFGMARGISSSPDSYNMNLTQYVATRWYRAPELMLLSLNYTAAIDVWSVGCILAEMLGRRQLFPGRDYRHQLELIFDVVGSPSHDYINLTSSEMIRDFLRKFGKKEPVVLQSKFPGANQKAVRLLSRMLKLNPADRISVEDALGDPYLSRYHDPEDEPICVPVFDFSFEKQRLNSAELRAVITKEIMDYHQPKSPALSLPFSLIPVPITQLTEPNKTVLPESSSDRPVTDRSDAVGKSDPSTEISSVDSSSLKNGNSSSLQVEDRQEKLILDGENELKDNGLAVKVEKEDENGNIEMRSAGRSQGSVLEAEVLGNDVSMPSARVLGERETAPADFIEQVATTSSTVSVASEAGTQPASAMDAKARIKAALLNSDRRRQQTELTDSSRQQSKGVTALQRQKEREEKRRLKMERVIEKKKKSRQKDNRPKGPTLSDEDRTLLERWEKMEKMVRSVRTSVSTNNEDSCSNPPTVFSISENSGDSLVYESPATPQSIRSSTPNILSTVDQNWTRQTSDGFSTLSGFSLNPTEAPSLHTCSATKIQPFFSQQPSINRPNKSHFNGGQFAPLISVLAQPSQTITSLPFTSYFSTGDSIHPAAYGFTAFQNPTGQSPGIAAQNLANNVAFDHNQLPPFAGEIQPQSLLIDENGKRFTIYDQQNKDFYRPQMAAASTSDPDWRFMMPSGTGSDRCRLEPAVSDLMQPSATSFRDLVDRAAVEQLPTATEVSRVASQPPDGLQVITSRLMRSHFDDLTLEHTPRGTGEGYGVGSFEMLSQSLFAGDSITPLDGPESAPLSATLMADWRSVTGDMDAKELEAVLQAELRGLIGSPRSINLNLNELT